METSIKVYQEVCYIETFDGEEIALNIPIDWLKEEIDNDKSKFLQIGTYFINKSTIKKFYSKKVNELENVILNIGDKDLREQVKKELELRKKEGKRINLEILQNIIQRYGK